jgi:hypothetical protein
MEKSTDLIPKHAFHTLSQFFSHLSADQNALINDVKKEIYSNLSQYVKCTGFRKPAKDVETIFLNRVMEHTRDQLFIVKRALMAKLAIHLPILLQDRNLPESILALYPDAFARLASFLKDTCDEPYDSTGEYFCKDIRFVLGLTIPCNALVVDLISNIALPSVILSFLRSKNIYGVVKYILSGGTGYWFRGHLEARYLTEVNEQGFDNCWFRISELLERRKNIKGYAGTSWLQAPQLPKVSPHLSYFMKPVREGGAFLLQHGTDPGEIENAIKTSETRRRLYHEGKYLPRSYSLLWPRKELIAWVKNQTNFHNHD